MAFQKKTQIGFWNAPKGGPAYFEMENLTQSAQRKSAKPLLRINKHAFDLKRNAFDEGALPICSKKISYAPVLNC